MVANRRPVQETYVSGNTVRVAEPAREPLQRPARKPVRRQAPEPSVKRRQAQTQAVKRNQEKALRMDLPYVVVLTLASVCALCICVSYLKVQSSIASRIDHIEALEQDLERLKSENDTLQTKINTDTDLERIFQIATEELGMVYANRDQVILYDKTESEYVRQYEDIPKN